LEGDRLLLDRAFIPRAGPHPFHRTEQVSVESTPRRVILTQPRELILHPLSLRIGRR
jgi:hypothetical protein